MGLVVLMQRSPYRVGSERGRPRPTGAYRSVVARLPPSRTLLLRRGRTGRGNQTDRRCTDMALSRGRQSAGRNARFATLVNPRVLAVITAACIVGGYLGLSWAGSSRDRSQAPSAAGVSPLGGAAAVLHRDWPGLVQLEYRDDRACNLFRGQSIPASPTGTFARCQATLRAENSAMRRLLRDLLSATPPPAGRGVHTVEAFTSGVQQFLAATTRTLTGPRAQALRRGQVRRVLPLVVDLHRAGQRHGRPVTEPARRVPVQRLLSIRRSRHRQRGAGSCRTSTPRRRSIGARC